MRATGSRAMAVTIALAHAWLLGYSGRFVVERWPGVPVSLISVVALLLLTRWLMRDLERER